MRVIRQFLYRKEEKKKRAGGGGGIVRGKITRATATKIKEPRLKARERERERPHSETSFTKTVFYFEISSIVSFKEKLCGTAKGKTCQRPSVTKGAHS